jgi:3-methyl-2-oxobutanoate hydroxymethyltransferase
VTGVDTLRRRADAGESVTMVTAYDHAIARLVERSEVDATLVGDSLGPAMLGYDRTDRVTVEDILHHARAVTRGTDRTHVVADLPFGTYNVTPEDAVRTANRLKRKSGVDAVKLEGGETVVPAVEALTEAGHTVYGHLGVTPQTDTPGPNGYAVRGRTDPDAEAVLAEARAVDDAGAGCLVLELVDADLARRVTDAVDALTFGIGAGPDCDAQVLTVHDLLGLGAVLPETASGVAGDLGDRALARLNDFAAAVGDGTFPEKD